VPGNKTLIILPAAFTFYKALREPVLYNVLGAAGHIEFGRELHQQIKKRPGEAQQ
jgi:hypothetical protein